MEKFKRVYDVMSRIGGYPDVRVTQVSNLEFRIDMLGEFMKGFMRLGEIQKEVSDELVDVFELKTIYGDGQDAVFRFIPKELR